MTRIHQCGEYGCHKHIPMEYRWCNEHYKRHHKIYEINKFKKENNPTIKRNRQRQTKHYDNNVRSKAKTVKSFNRSKFYRSTEWKNVREYVLNRDYFTCQICNVAKNRMYVDHVIPLKYCDEIKAIDVNNLWTLCSYCHNKKTKLEQQLKARELIQSDSLYYYRKLHKN